MPDTWEALEHECKNCRECSLWETRTNVVFGVGNQNAEVLFIGEGPGANEDAQGVPFVGRAGHLLDDMLEIIGLKRDDVYIANIVKCRPPENRDPLGVEQDACIGYLRRQVALLRPNITPRHCCAIRAAGPSRLRISRAYSRRSMSFASTPMPFPNANSILFGAVPCQIPT